MSMLLTLGSAFVRLDRWSESNSDAPNAGTEAANSDEDRPQDAPPQDAAPQDGSPQRDGRTTAENITTAISVLLIALLAGTLLYEGYATGQSEPATLEVTVLTEEIEQRGDAFYVPIEIVNTGDQTAEEVAISIELLDGEEVVDEAETVIATLGEAETIKAVLVVSEDPSALEIEAGVVTYQIAED